MHFNLTVVDDYRRTTYENLTLDDLLAHVSEVTAPSAAEVALPENTPEWESLEDSPLTDASDGDDDSA